MISRISLHCNSFLMLSAGGLFTDNEKTLNGSVLGR